MWKEKSFNFSHAPVRRLKYINVFCLAGDADASERPVPGGGVLPYQVNDSNGESFVISIDKILTKLL